MVPTERALIQFLITIFTINGLHSISPFRDKSLGFISELIGRDSKSPFIVVVNTAKDIQGLEDDMIRDDDYASASEIESRNTFDDSTREGNDYKSVLQDVLRTGNRLPVDKKERKIARDKLIEEALRERCQAVVRCTEMCSESKANSCESSDSCETTTPKREKYCPKSCKAVFDELMRCPPPGNRKKSTPRPKKERSNECGAKNGKTCPPSW